MPKVTQKRVSSTKLSLVDFVSGEFSCREPMSTPTRCLATSGARARKSCIKRVPSRRVKPQQVRFAEGTDEQRLTERPERGHCMWVCRRRELPAYLCGGIPGALPNDLCPVCNDWFWSWGRYDYRKELAFGPHNQHERDKTNERHRCTAMMKAAALHHQAWGSTAGLWLPVLIEEDAVQVFDWRLVRYAPEDKVLPRPGPTLRCTHEEFRTQYTGEVGRDRLRVYPVQFGPRGLVRLSESGAIMPSRIIMDTGCGYNVISKAYADAHGLPRHGLEKHERRTFNGVGGHSECTDTASMQIEEFGEEARFLIAGHSPALQSVGRRCQEQGFSFVWPAGWGSTPYFVTPWGTKVPLIVDDCIPYLQPGDPRCAPTPLEVDDLRVPTPPAFDTVAGCVHARPVSDRLPLQYVLVRAGDTFPTSRPPSSSLGASSTTVGGVTPRIMSGNLIGHSYGDSDPVTGGVSCVSCGGDTNGVELVYVCAPGRRDLKLEANQIGEAP